MTDKLILAPGETEETFYSNPLHPTQAQRRIGFEACERHYAEQAKADVSAGEVPDGFRVESAMSQWEKVIWFTEPLGYWWQDEYATEAEAIAACHEHRARILRPYLARIAELEKLTEDGQLFRTLVRPWKQRAEAAEARIAELETRLLKSEQVAQSAQALSGMFTDYKNGLESKIDDIGTTLMFTEEHLGIVKDERAHWQKRAEAAEARVRELEAECKDRDPWEHADELERWWRAAKRALAKKVQERELLRSLYSRLSDEYSRWQRRAKAAEHQLELADFEQANELNEKDERIAELELQLKTEHAHLMHRYCAPDGAMRKRIAELEEQRNRLLAKYEMWRTLFEESHVYISSKCFELETYPDDRALWMVESET